MQETKLEQRQTKVQRCKQPCQHHLLYLLMMLNLQTKH